jgi:hypothetical protein
VEQIGYPYRVHNLDLPPSCIEFLPLGLKENKPSYFVVGTYNLQTEDETPAVDKEDVFDTGLSVEDKASNEARSVVSDELPKSQSRDGSLNLFRIEEDNL